MFYFIFIALSDVVLFSFCRRKGLPFLSASCLNYFLLLLVDLWSQKDSTKHNICSKCSLMVGDSWTHIASNLYNIVTEHSIFCSSFAACNLWCRSWRFAQWGTYCQWVHRVPFKSAVLYLIRWILYTLASSERDTFLQFAFYKIHGNKWFLITFTLYRKAKRFTT